MLNYIKLDVALHFLVSWEHVFSVVNSVDSQVAKSIKAEFLSTAYDVFGEPFPNVACTPDNFRLYIQTLNPILNRFGYALHLTTAGGNNGRDT